MNKQLTNYPQAPHSRRVARAVNSVRASKMCESKRRRFLTLLGTSRGLGRRIDHLLHRGDLRRGKSTDRRMLSNNRLIFWQGRRRMSYCRRHSSRPTECRGRAAARPHLTSLLLPAADPVRKRVPPLAARKVFLASPEKHSQILQETRANSAFNFEFAMSALGQKQTCAAQKVMSAFPPKADMCAATKGCPLCANSGHRAAYSITLSVRC